MQHETDHKRDEEKKIRKKLPKNEMAKKWANRLGRYPYMEVF